jgi:hypothetical protein
MHKVFKMRPLVVGLIHEKRKQGKEWQDMHNKEQQCKCKLQGPSYHTYKA